MRITEFMGWKENISPGLTCSGQGYEVGTVEGIRGEKGRYEQGIAWGNMMSERPEKRPA